MSDIPGWHIVGEWFDNCSCAVPCPCTFAQAPDNDFWLGQKIPTAPVKRFTNPFCSSLWLLEDGPPLLRRILLTDESYLKSLPLGHV